MFCLLLKSLLAQSSRRTIFLFDVGLASNLSKTAITASGRAYNLSKVWLYSLFLEKEDFGVFDTALEPPTGPHDDPQDLVQSFKKCS